MHSYGTQRTYGGGLLAADVLVGLDQAVLVVDHQTVVVLARTEAEHNLHRMTLHETKYANKH